MLLFVNAIMYMPQCAARFSIMQNANEFMAMVAQSNLSHILRELAMQARHQCDVLNGVGKSDEANAWQELSDMMHDAEDLCDSEKLTFRKE